MTWHISLRFDLNLNLINYKCIYSLMFRSLDAVAFLDLMFWSRGPVSVPFPASWMLLTLDHLILLGSSSNPWSRVPSGHSVKLCKLNVLCFEISQVSETSH